MTTFKTVEDLRKRLEYVWDYADKNGDINFLLKELWKDIQATKDEVKNVSSNSCVSGQRELLLAFKNWEIDNDIKNLTPEQLVEFYIDQSKQ